MQQGPNLPPSGLEQGTTSSDTPTPPIAATIQPAMISVPNAAPDTSSSSLGTPPFGLFKPNIPMPVFSGNPRQLQEFLGDLQQVMILSNILKEKPTVQIVFAAQCLKGNAKTWWQSLWGKGIPQQWTDINEFAAAIKKEYMPSDLTARLWDDWGRLPQQVQGGWSDANALERRVRQLCLQLGDRLPDDMIVNHFIRCLQPDIQYMVRLAHPATLDAAAAAARDVLQCQQFKRSPRPVPYPTQPFSGSSSSGAPSQQQFGGPTPMELGGTRAAGPHPITCFKCGQPGHKACDCRNKQQQQPGGSGGGGRGRGDRGGFRGGRFGGAAPLRGR